MFETPVWVELISLILNLVLASGFVVTVVTLKAEKKKKSAEALSAEADVKLAELEVAIKEEDFDDRRLKDKIAIIIEQDAIIKELRDKLVEVEKKQLALKLELIKESEARLIAEFNVCNVLSCANRMPPRDEINDKFSKRTQRQMV